MTYVLCVFVVIRETAISFDEVLTLFDLTYKPDIPIWVLKLTLEMGCIENSYRFYPQNPAGVMGSVQGD